MSKPRIESHTLNVFAGRKADEGEWDIPLDGVSHHWTVPLVVMEEQGARRVGTAFHVGRLGHLLSARHCVDEALHPAHRGVDLGPEARRVQLLSQLAVIRATDTSREQLRGLAVQTVTGPEPSDLVCLSTIFQTELPQLTLPMSFVLPDVGSTVRCFGFPDPNGPKLFPDYLHAVEGSVKAYFPPGFSR